MTPAQRQHGRALMDYLFERGNQWDYPPGDQRDNRDSFSWHLSEEQMHRFLQGGGRPSMDCSEFGSWILKAVGCWRWPEPGYTGSHLQLLHPHYSDGRIANSCALVVFGPDTGHHEAIVHTPDPKHGNPILMSHGSPGLHLVSLDELAAAQKAEGFPGVTFLSVAHL